MASAKLETKLEVYTYQLKELGHILVFLIEKKQKCIFHRFMEGLDVIMCLCEWVTTFIVLEGTWRVELTEL